jgi:hypothetical protein
MVTRHLRTGPQDRTASGTEAIKHRQIPAYHVHTELRVWHGDSELLEYWSKPVSIFLIASVASLAFCSVVRGSPLVDSD